MYIAVFVVFLVTPIIVATSSVLGAVVGGLAAGALSGEHLVPPPVSESVASAALIQTTAEPMPTAKQTRRDIEDECPKFESEIVVSEKRSEKHIEDHATLVVAELVRSTGFGEKVGEISMMEKDGVNFVEINMTEKTAESSVKSTRRKKTATRSVRSKRKKKATTSSVR